MRRNRSDHTGLACDCGAALVAALIAMFLMMTLGLALVLITNTELTIAANYNNSQQAFYAAEAGLELALHELVTIADWNTVLAGGRTATRVDGPPHGVRVLPDGSTIDLTQATNLANCGTASSCSVIEMSAATEERPWGTNNPWWMLYMYGPLAELLPGRTVDGSYLVVWVGDDPGENDGDPLRDGSVETNPGLGVIAVRSAAYGTGGTRRVIEATLARTPANTPRIISWHEVSVVER